MNFGWKHHFNNLNTKMTHFHILKMRLLWKLGKMVAKLDSRGKISWSQFWRFFNQISFISWEKQYLWNDLGVFWYFENFSSFLIFCKKNTKICIFSHFLASQKKSKHFIKKSLGHSIDIDLVIILAKFHTIR